MFGIGRNKTGTTSLQHALRHLGYRVAPTALGEVLLSDWKAGNFDSICDLCRDFDAFQDIPFSLPECFKHLDHAFPKSKFVLTVRDSPTQWFNSLSKFHAKKFGNGHVPSWEDLEQATYRYPGFIADCQEFVYNAKQVGLYNEDAYTKHYCDYNNSVRAYFADRPRDFLEMNVAQPDSFRRLCAFLGAETDRDEFPWENQT